MEGVYRTIILLIGTVALILILTFALASRVGTITGGIGGP